jgi:hypothetical protein
LSRPRPPPDPSDLGGGHAEKERELRHPLFEQGAAVNQDERASASLRDEIGPNHRLAHARWSDEDAQVVLEQRPGRLLLGGRQLAVEPLADVFAELALVLGHDRNPVFRKQREQVVLTAAGQRHVPRVLLRTSDHPGRLRRREPEVLPLVELGILEGGEPLDLVEEGRGKPGLLDEQPLGDDDADFGRQRSLDQGPPKAPRRGPPPGLGLLLTG